LTGISSDARPRSTAATDLATGTSSRQAALSNSDEPNTERTNILDQSDSVPQCNLEFSRAPSRWSPYGGQSGAAESAAAQPGVVRAALNGGGAFDYRRDSVDGRPGERFERGEIGKVCRDVVPEHSVDRRALGLHEGAQGLAGGWSPIPPRTPKQLAETSARLCRLLRAEVEEQLERHDPTLVGLADDWRHLLFPDATDDQFADSYAQAVTFGLLLARAQGIDLEKGIDPAAKVLAGRQSLIGTAMRVLTDQVIKNKTLATSLATLTTWGPIAAERAEAQIAIRQGGVSSGYRCCIRTERQRRRA
jgi:hypothetical protein